MINIQNFRTDFRAFRDTTRFPDAFLAYWMQVASLLLNQDRFGSPAPYIISAAGISTGGTNYAPGDTINLTGGTFTTPVTLQVSTVGPGGVITATTITNNGVYSVQPTNPVGQGSTSGVGTGASFNLTFVSGPYTEYDIAAELFIAHNLVLDRKAQDEADAGGLPGQAFGPVNSKTVGGVSVGYDIALASYEGMGDWNLTTYGTRFARLVKLFGMGPLTIVGDCWPSWLNGPAWPGPLFPQGIDWTM